MGMPTSNDLKEAAKKTIRVGGVHSGAMFTATVLHSGAVWPDLSKFRHISTLFKVLGNFLRVYLVFGKIMILLWQKCFTIGQVFIAVDGQIL